MSYSVLDLFSGAGGLSYGFSQSGFYIKTSIEIDKHAAGTHSFNFPDTTMLQQDINSLSPKKEFSKGEFDIIIGGPPCQGFSIIGRPKIASLVRKGIWSDMKISVPRFVDDPRNNLYKTFLEFVKELKPLFFVMENVPGLLSYQKGKLVKEIIKDFEACGYQTSVKNLLAADFGVPQLRKRLFFIGNCLNLNNEFPEPTHTSKNGKSCLNSNLETKKLKKYVSLKKAILDLPKIKNCGGKEKIEYSTQPFSLYQKRMRNGSQYVYNHVSRCNNERDVRAFRALEQGQIYNDLPKHIKDTLPFRQDIFKDKFRRLDCDKPSWTIVAHLHKDGYMFIHPIQQRSITVREAARIQSFPDTFIFQGPRTSQFKQVGNAVPPLLAQAIAEKIDALLR